MRARDTKRWSAPEIRGEQHAGMVEKRERGVDTKSRDGADRRNERAYEVARQAKKEKERTRSRRRETHGRTAGIGKLVVVGDWERGSADGKG